MRFDIDYKAGSRRNSVERCVEHGLSRSIRAREQLLELGELEMEVHGTQRKEEERCATAKRMGVAPMSLLEMEKQANDEILVRTYGERSLSFASRSQFRCVSRGSNKSQREARTASSSKATSRVSDPGGSSDAEESGDDEAERVQQPSASFLLRISVPGNMQHGCEGFMLTSSDYTCEQGPHHAREDSQASTAERQAANKTEAVNVEGWANPEEGCYLSPASAPMPTKRTSTTSTHSSTAKLTGTLSARAKPAWEEVPQEIEGTEKGAPAPACPPTAGAATARASSHARESKPASLLDRPTTASASSHARESKPGLLDRLRRQFSGSARRLRNSSSNSREGACEVPEDEDSSSVKESGSNSMGATAAKSRSIEGHRSVAAAASSVCQATAGLLGTPDRSSRSYTHMGSRASLTAQRSPSTSATLPAPLQTPRRSKDALQPTLSTWMTQNGTPRQTSFSQPPRRDSMQDNPRHGSIQETNSDAFSGPTSRSSLMSSRTSVERGSSSRKTSLDRSGTQPCTSHRARSRSCVLTQGEVLANMGGYVRQPSMVHYHALPAGVSANASQPAAAAKAASAAFAAPASGTPRRKSVTIMPPTKSSAMDGIIADLLAP